MTDDEGKDFIRRLVIAFPAVDEIAKFNSPDLGATHRSWLKTLSRCTLAECDEVLDFWIASDYTPDKTDLRLPAHAIRATVMRKRDREQSQKRAEEDAQRARRRRGTFQEGINKRLGGDAVASVVRLRPIHKRMLDGEISRGEYQAVLEAELATLEEHAA